MYAARIVEVRNRLMTGRCKNEFGQHMLPAVALAGLSITSPETTSSTLRKSGPCAENPERDMSNGAYQPIRLDEGKPPIFW